MRFRLPAHPMAALPLCLAWLTAVGAMLIVCLLTVRTQLTSLLETEAQDSAVALATALAPHTGEDQALYRKTLLKGFTESGAYRMVTFILITGGQIRQEVPDYPAAVPQWFQAILPFEPPTAEAEVLHGWDLAGYIVVSRQTASAYLLLWHTALGIVGAGLVILAGLLWWWWSRLTQVQNQQQNSEYDELRRELEATQELLFNFSSLEPEGATQPGREVLNRLIKAQRFKNRVPADSD
ncbi:LapD/MoxY N-terminal periplasmic domain-containing protein [Microbulbifer pacificus]|uniref:LapD/MoxY N-terminal periplasmic domain-containing protein n=1 Tax=Microbulbifer pacificus TaxID=407164 RepID=A0AAU0MXA4_9GAMM|nr:LapD/MoxY N-terminal periplasmic domain-containing protein [Microbulbifer pacificus]WOX04830.1 LapD/MoxY N-terminal periplasmic domain-containing protein [Microbulbifer pacificus]